VTACVAGAGASLGLLKAAKSLRPRSCLPHKQLGSPHRILAGLSGLEEDATTNQPPCLQLRTSSLEFGPEAVTSSVATGFPFAAIFPATCDQDKSGNSNHSVFMRRIRRTLASIRSIETAPWSTRPRVWAISSANDTLAEV
jgi:hypothetical protein